MEAASLTAPTPGRMQTCRCSCWIRWLLGRVRSLCANKLGGGQEREKTQRAAKRFDDDVHREFNGLRLLLLAAVIMAATSLPAQTNRCQTP